MGPQMKEALLLHLKNYVEGYMAKGATLEGSVMNYVREFPARLHLVILALGEHLWKSNNQST